MVLCPIIAILGQVFAIYLLFKNIDVLAGTIGYVDLIGPIAVIGVAIGLGYAFALKRTNRKKFDMIGRMIDEGVIEEPDEVPACDPGSARPASFAGAPPALSAASSCPLSGAPSTSTPSSAAVPIVNAQAPAASSARMRSSESTEPAQMTGRSVGARRRRGRAPRRRRRSGRRAG